VGLLLSISVCDVTSKMSADEELESAAASAATILLVAFSCKRNRKRAKWQHKYYGL